MKHFASEDPEQGPTRLVRIAQPRGLRVVMLPPKPRTTTCHGPFAEHDHGTYGEAGSGWVFFFPFKYKGRSLSQVSLNG